MFKQPSLLTWFYRRSTQIRRHLINGGHLKETLFSVGIERFGQMLEGKPLIGVSAGLTCYQGTPIQWPS